MTTTVQCFRPSSLPTFPTKTFSTTTRRYVSSKPPSSSSSTNLFYKNNSTTGLLLEEETDAVIEDAVRNVATTATAKSTEQRRQKQRKRKQRPIIYCDMDGVLVDFEAGVRKVLRESTKSYEGYTGVDNRRKQLWKQLQLKGTIHWFKSLDWTTDGKLLWEYIKPLQPTILSGVPYMLVPYACHDKYEWCCEKLGMDPSSIEHIDMAALHTPINNGHVRVNKNPTNMEDNDSTATSTIQMG